MSRLKEIHKAIQDILGTCPNHSGKIYLLEPYVPEMRSIEIMYDTYYTERKCLYIDKYGAYINGRGQGQGDKNKMYLHEFDNLTLSQEGREYIDMKVREINASLDTRINSRDIKAGMMCREFVKNRKDGDFDYYTVYLGKIKAIKDYTTARSSYLREKGVVESKLNVYLRLYKDANITISTNDWGGLECNGYFYHEKSKIRFDKIIKTIDDENLKKLRKLSEKSYCRNDYEDFITIEWLD